MSFRLSNGHVWFTIMLGLFGAITTVSAQQTHIDKQATLNGEILFSAKPANCVALHQGRQCYAKVSLQWNAPNVGDFCIHEKVSGKKLQCWESSNGNNVQFEFESSSKIEYQLKSNENNRVLAETAINVSWVHKASPRKRRWRLF